MLFLALDSSAVCASCAVLDDDKILSEFYLNAGLTHSQTLMPMVEAALRLPDVSVEQIDAFVVTVGPGSFTGVRIGVSAVKGMAMAAHKPCVGVSALEAVAYNMAGQRGTVCAVMDARCGQVYNALFALEEGLPRRICDDRALAITDLAEELGALPHPIHLVGDGAELCYEALLAAAPGVALAPPHLRYQRAAGAGAAAYRGWPEGQTDAAALRPLYLRLPQAERELRKRQAIDFRHSPFTAD